MERLALYLRVVGFAVQLAAVGVVLGVVLARAYVRRALR